MLFLKILLIILAVLAGLFILTFVIYWFNADMKLVRVIYDKLQPHYDNLEKDKKL
ncbi:MAG: hypothetical protein II744_04855 [Eubacterium sp.]|nr:hypothetical protein [Eubacterium sp.]MBR6392922.1 hypothetical protein [Eubacterium sp.]MBR7072594.1 hypothetical protein [Eubacterium sp.]